MASSTLGTGFFQPQARPGGVTIATERLAEEIAPFMQDYLERESALATLRTEGFRDEETGELVLDPVTGEPIDPGGYRPFTGPTIAEFTPEQLEAQRGLAGLAGFDISVDPTTGERTITQTGPGITADRFDEAEALIRAQPEQYTGDVAEKFMSPFQQAVVDIEKREAQQKFEQELLPKVQAAAIQSGSFGGSRGALLEAEALRGQGQLLSDIQRKGSQAAYDRGLKAFQAQKGREAATAQGLTGLATGEFGQRAKELSGIERVGALQQQQTQTALDEAYKEFLEEQAFPESVLDRMQAAAFGFPAIRQEVRQSPTTFGPSQFQSLATNVGTLGTLAGNLFGQLGGQRAAPPRTGRKRGGLVSRRDGGLVPLVRRKISGGLTPANFSPGDSEVVVPQNSRPKSLSEYYLDLERQRENQRRKARTMADLKQAHLRDRRTRAQKLFDKRRARADKAKTDALLRASQADEAARTAYDERNKLFGIPNLIPFFTALSQASNVKDKRGPQLAGIGAAARTIQAERLAEDKRLSELAAKRKEEILSSSADRLKALQEAREDKEETLVAASEDVDLAAIQRAIKQTDQDITQDIDILNKLDTIAADLQKSADTLSAKKFKNKLEATKLSAAIITELGQTAINRAGIPARYDEDGRLQRIGKQPLNKKDIQKAEASLGQIYEVYTFWVNYTGDQSLAMQKVKSMKTEDANEESKVKVPTKNNKKGKTSLILPPKPDKRNKNKVDQRNQRIE